jgi:zinc transporter ZupT
MESEVIEIFNQLVTELNISDPDTNETCFYEDHHHEENNATEDHHEEEHDDHEEEHDEEHEEEHEVTPFCASLYSLARQMMLSLNYTTLSCLENGTVERSAIPTKAPPSHTNPSLAYGVGFVAVVVVSLVSLIGVLTVPVAGKSIMRYLSAFLVAMGISALASDAVLHLIPHSFLASREGGHDHAEEGGHSEEFEIIWKGSALLGAILIFYVFEFFMKFWRDWSKSKAAKSKKSSPPSAGTMELAQVEITDQTIQNQGEGPLDTRSAPVTSSETKEELNSSKDAAGSDSKSITNMEEESNHPHFNPNQGFCHGIVPVAWIIIFGDALHNFADGIAIGAAFSISMGGGLSTSLAILLHEIPHELGDYAILLSTGMKWYIAALYNLLSALTAVVGVFIGVAISNVSEAATSWIFIIAAGIFLYVALVDMLPALFEAKYKGKQRWILFGLQMFGFLFAYAILVILAIYEHQLETLIVV